MSYRTLNPATGETVRVYPEHSWAQSLEALSRSETAFATWRDKTIAERVGCIRNLAELLRSRLPELARLITLEMGKPIAQAEIEIDKCARGAEYYVRTAEESLREHVVVTDAARSYVRYDPLGVILGIMPWNFPFWQVLRFSLPALAAGNVVLLKHAPNVPACALEIESLFEKTGFPKGVFQNLFLTNENVERLIGTGRIQGVSLTGSEKAGSAVASTAGRYLVKTVLELGGSDPFVVFEDADLDGAVSVAVQSRFMNAGQSCIAAKRILVATQVYDKFRDRLVEAVKKLKLGDPAERETDIGPMAREDLLQNLLRQVNQLKTQGARCILEGGPVGKGYFFRPAIFESIISNRCGLDEEIFGPVALLQKFDTEEEALRLANETRYGLGASLWSRDTSRMEGLARRIEAGSVFINGLVKSDPRLPFGGVKKSGYGRELSEIGLHEFTNIKTVWVK